MTETPTAAQILARHFVAADYNGATSSNLASAKVLLSDYLGVGIGGSTTDSAQIAADFAVELAGRADASIIGRHERVPAPQAAFANAIASHSIELDDVDVLALFHFSPPVVSGAIAAAQLSGASGRDLLIAIVAGCEMMTRLSNATNNSLRDRGFHTTPTCGVFGAAIAAGRLLGLSEAQMVDALGLAGAQASGLMEMYGPSMQKRFNPGPAARNGVTAAMLAKSGYTGAATIFDGERGFLNAFSDTGDRNALLAALDTPVPLEVEYKPYSCARPIHNAIDCALEIRPALVGNLDQVKAITMRRHPDWAHYHTNPSPRTYHEAQVSLPFSVAVALIEGQALPPQYSDANIASPAVKRLAELVEIVPDASLQRGVSCLMLVETVDGRTLKAEVDHPKGSIVNPMSGDELAGKVRRLAEPVIGVAATGRLLAIIDDLEERAGIEDLLVCTARPPASAEKATA